MTTNFLFFACQGPVIWWARPIFIGQNSDC